MIAKQVLNRLFLVLHLQMVSQLETKKVMTPEMKMETKLEMIAETAK